MNGGPSGDLGYNTNLISTVSKEVVTKFQEVRGKIETAFGTFVTSSNQEWYAVNAKTFFVGVGQYADELCGELFTTGESFLSSLESAAKAWYGMTGNEYETIALKISDTDKKETCVKKCDDYHTDLNKKVFMTDTCEKNVANFFQKFAEDVKAAIEDVASVLNKGELIGGQQSEAYINMIKAIATKYEQSMVEQKAELQKALKDSRFKYEQQATNVANAKLEDSGS